MSDKTPVDFDPFAGGDIVLSAPVTEPQQEIWLAIAIGGDEASLAEAEGQLGGEQSVVAVDVAGEREAVGGADLDEIQHHRAVAGGHHGGELVEMAGAAAVATQGITVASFPAGTIFSVKLNPLRDGSNFGSRVGAIAKCPKGKVPDAGKFCDSVEGGEVLGGSRGFSAKY